MHKAENVRFSAFLLSKQNKPIFLKPYQSLVAHFAKLV